MNHRYYKPTLILFLILFFFAPCAFSQNYSSYDSRVQIANLTQDVRQLAQKIGRLEVRIEQLERENSALRNKLVDQKTLNARLSKFESALQAELNGLSKDFASADEAQKKAIIEAVSDQIGNLAEQTQKTIDALAEYVGHQGTSIPAVEFSDDYPNTGFRYEVKPGDSLAKIADMHDVSIRDIINANRLVNPDKIQVGQNLFIPKPQN